MTDLSGGIEMGGMEICFGFWLHRRIVGKGEVGLN